MKKLLFIILVLFFASVSNAQLSGTYTIGTGGDYTTITSAVSDLVANGISSNVVFNIIDGTYNEQISIPAITGASATDSIIFQSQSADTSKVRIYYGATDASTNWVIDLDGCSYISFKNLTVQAVGGSSEVGAVFTNSTAVSYINFFGNHIIGKGTSATPYNAKAAIKLDLSGGNLNINIYGNTVENCKYYIRTASATNVTISHNKFLNQSTTSLSISHIKNLNINNNYVYGDINPYYASGFLKIYNNNVEYTIDVYSVNLTSGKVQVYNNTANIIWLRSAKHINVYHNTLSKQIWVYTSCEDVNIANNLIISDNASEPAIKIEDLSAINYLDYNDVYTPNLLYQQKVSEVYQDYTSLSAWQTATSFSANSYSQEVSFDGDRPKLYICAEPLVGTDVGISKDFEGDARTLPIIGADEYAYFYFTATASDTIFKSNTSIDFSADNSWGGTINWTDPSGYDFSSDFSFSYTPTLSGEYKAMWTGVVCKDSAFINLVIDNTVPSLSLVSDFNLYLDNTGNASLLPSDIVSSASDNILIADTVISQTDFDYSDCPSADILVTVTDAAGNFITDNTTISIFDTISPVLTTKDITIALDVSNQASIVADDVILSVSDNCWLSDTTLSKNNFTLSDIGENIITVTVYDSAGNSVAKTAKVTVNSYTNILDINSSSFKIYPNPVLDMLHINLMNSNSAEVTVFDVAGNLILQQSIGKSNNKIDFSDMNSGIYIINIKTLEADNIIKIIKQ